MCRCTNITIKENEHYNDIKRCRILVYDCIYIYVCVWSIFSGVYRLLQYFVRMTTFRSVPVAQGPRRTRKCTRHRTPVKWQDINTLRSCTMCSIGLRVCHSFLVLFCSLVFSFAPLSYWGVHIKDNMPNLKMASTVFVTCHVAQEANVGTGFHFVV